MLLDDFNKKMEKHIRTIHSDRNEIIYYVSMVT